MRHIHLLNKNDLKILLFVALSNDLFTPDITIPGIPTAVDNFNIICRLDGVVERLVGTRLVVVHFIISSGGFSTDLSRDGLAYITSRFFYPGTTVNTGICICHAIVISSLDWVFFSSSSGTLQIKVSNVTSNS